MPKATNTHTTALPGASPPNPSRRATLLGSAAALVAGTAVATTARGAPAAAGADAELLALCGEFHRLDADASSSADDGDARAALRRRSEVSDEIQDIAPQTDAGRRAKAHVAIILLTEQNGASPTDADVRFAMAVLRDITGSAAA